jgi:hypothetical protein
LKTAALLFLALCSRVGAATLYCSAVGGGSGADFNNLATLPDGTNAVRGNEYVIVDDVYGSYDLLTATSGTTTITIRKANAAQDMFVAGYNASLHDSEAVFGTIRVGTRYWIVDGKTRSELTTWAGPTGYGISADQIRANSNEGDDADFSQFRYLDLGSTYATNPSNLTINGYNEAAYIVFNQANLTFHRCALHNGKPALMQAAGATGLTVEYCHFGPGWGKEAIRGGNGPATDWVLRHNRFWDSTQTNPNDGSSGITAEIAIFGNDNLTYTGIAIHGNWFVNSKTGGRNGVIIVGGVGFTDTSSGTLVYGNTFAGVVDTTVFGMVYLSGTGNVARNNLFYDNAENDVSANTASNNVTAGVDPFVNYSTLDLRLSGATTAGFTLSAPYDTDPLGNARGGDGTWDVGAYEFGGEEPPPDPGATFGTLNATTITITSP